MILEANIQVNPKIWQALQGAKTRFIVNYGGSGSGKSHTQAQHEVLKLLSSEKKEKILVIRKTATSLRDSVIPLVTQQIIPSLGLTGQFNYNKSDRHLWFKLGLKNEMIFRGLDDPEKIKSIAGITRIWIEEASEITEQDFEQLNLRLRGQQGMQIVLTFNPIDEGHWLKKRFFDTLQDNATLIKTTYKDNVFIDEDYKAELQRLKNIDFNYYRIYALGEWGKLDSGAEFLKHFKAEKHSSQLELNPAEPLHLSFDENVSPYLTLTIWQVDAKAKLLKQVHEILPAHPNNTVTKLAQLFNEWALAKGCTEVCYVYGDSSSLKQDTKIEKGKNFFNLLTDKIANRCIMRVPSSNPSIAMSGSFINSILEHNFEGWRITISSSCTTSIADYKYTKESIEGKILKQKVKNPKTGVSYEPYGHIVDSMRYIVCTLLADEYRKYQTGYSKFPVLLGKRGGGKRRF